MTARKRRTVGHWPGGPHIDPGRRWISAAAAHAALRSTIQT
jgi:hypothetical protein